MSDDTAPEPQVPIPGGPPAWYPEVHPFGQPPQMGPEEPEPGPADRGPSRADRPSEWPGQPGGTYPPGLWWPSPAADSSRYPDPEAATGPPWPRLVAADRSFRPPRLARWPIVVGIVLFAGWIAINATSAASGPHTGSGPDTGFESSTPYVFTATDAQFTATFPSEPQRKQQTVGAITIVEYVSTFSDHAVAVGDLEIPSAHGFSLDGGITGVATSLKDGKVISREKLTYQGQPAEDAVIAMSGGVGRVREVDYGTSVYVLVGFGSSTGSFSRDYDQLLATFTTSATPSPASSTALPAAAAPPSNVGSAPAIGAIGAKVIAPPPPGFAIAEESGVQNGSVNAAGFNSYLGVSGAAAKLHYVTGYELTYNSVGGTDSYTVALFRFASPDDATTFVAGFSGPGFTATIDGPVPGETIYDSTTTDRNGSWDHGVIAAKGSTAMVIVYTSLNREHPPLVDTLARRQYAKL